jgi:hypothetical protein
MKALYVTLAGVIAGVCSSVVAYAALCGYALSVSDEVVGRAALAARVTAVMVVSAAVFVVSMWWVKQNRIRLKWLTWGTTCVAVSLVLFAFYLYPVAGPFSSATDRDDLERAAAQINAARGSHEVPFPKEYVYIVERRMMPNGTRLDIYMSKRFVARLVGIDLIKVDGVAVEIADGKVRRAWVDYF